MAQDAQREEMGAVAAVERPGRGGYWRLKLVGGLLVAAFFLWYFAGKADRLLLRLGVGTAEAVFGTVETRFAGRAVLLRTEHVVTAAVPGRVTLLVGEGRHVRTGDLVIELRDEVAGASRELDEVNRRLAQADLAYEEERTRLVRRREDLATRLADARRVLSEALAQGDPEVAREAESRYKSFQREMAQVEEALADLAAREERERRELLSRRQQLMSFGPGDTSLVRAPAAGVVSFTLDGLESEAVPGANLLDVFGLRSRDRRVQDGAWVAAGEPLFRLVETDGIEVAVRLKGAALEAGSRVILDFHGIPERSFTGRLVESIALDGEFYGRVRLDAFDPSLVLRRTIDVTLTTERRQGIVVPASAVVERNGKRGVYLVVGETSVFREVRVLGGNDRQAVIDSVSGVPAGARVVVDPRRLRTR